MKYKACQVCSRDIVNNIRNRADILPVSKNNDPIQRLLLSLTNEWDTSWLFRCCLTYHCKWNYQPTVMWVVHLESRLLDITIPSWRGVSADCSLGVPEGRPLWNTCSSVVRSMAEGQLWKRKGLVLGRHQHRRSSVEPAARDEPIGTGMWKMY